MKIFYTILLLLSLLTVGLVAQNPGGPVIGKAVYFDVSSPLRDRYNEPMQASDCSWKEGYVSNTFSVAGIGEHFFPSGKDTVIQQFHGNIYPDTLTRNFDGLGNVNNVVPPDTYGDVGPGHYFQLVNLSFAIYDKTGEKLLGPLNTSVIWEGLPHNFNNGDGVVLYDEQADRWIVSQFSFPSFPVAPFYLMVAVSQTPDPLGAWYRWEFVFNDLPDYPKFGIWSDGYYLSYGRIKSVTLQQDGVGAVAFNRNAMLAGDPAPANISFTIPSSECAINFLPADCDGSFPPAGTPNYYGYLRGGNFVVREFHADWTSPAASTMGNVLNLPVSPYTLCTKGIMQKESDKELTPLDDRLMYRLQYRNFGNHQSMVVNHTVGVGSHAGIRWYELQKTTGYWFIRQQSTYSPDTLSRWMGSIAMDQEGNIALGYSVSSGSVFPSVRFTGRTKNDPPGQMTIGETTIVDGTGSQTGIWAGQSRWGDYSSMTVDPVSPLTFWYSQEYYAITSNNSWKTRIASFSFANIIDIRAVAAPPMICTGGSTQLDAVVTGGSGLYTYSWTSEPAGFTSSEKNPVISPLNPATYIVQVSDGTQEKTDSVAVQILPVPSVFAGNDTTICRYITDLPVAGIVTNCISVKWTTSGDGYFADPGALNTKYIPGTHDTLSNYYLLYLTAYPATPCLPVSSTRKITVDPCLGIEEAANRPVMVNLFPNPAHEELTIEIAGLRDQNGSISISNAAGEILYMEYPEFASPSYTKHLNLSRFSEGMYFLKVQAGSKTITRSFIVK